MGLFNWFSGEKKQTPEVKYPPTRLLYFDKEDPIDPDWGKAAFVDVETTGLDPTTEEIVELSIMLFAYDKGNGKIFGVLEEYTGRREPSEPIPKEAYKIHGITDKKLKENN